jgi:hypothetical protein
VAYAHPARTEPTILTVNDLAKGVTFQFSDSDLAALEQQSFDTSTIWTHEVNTFSGPSLHDVLAAVGAAPARLRIYAINDYAVNFPLEKIKPTTPIIANRVDQSSFSVRHKGPLWVMFPFDKGSEFQNEETFALSVWQVRQIDILAD